MHLFINLYNLSAAIDLIYYSSIFPGYRGWTFIYEITAPKSGSIWHIDDYFMKYQYFPQQGRTRGNGSGRHAS